PDLAPEGALAKAAAATGLVDRFMAAAPCPVLPLPGTPARLDGLVPGTKLRVLRRARRLAAAAGGLVLETIGEDRLDAALDDLCHLHDLRWRTRGESGVCHDPRV